MTKHTQAASRAQAHRFFSLGAKYLIDPTNNSVDLKNDVACLVDTAQSTLTVLIDGVIDQGSNLSESPNDIVSLLYSVRYQLQMVGNIVEAMEVRS